MNIDYLWEKKSKFDQTGKRNKKDKRKSMKGERKDKKMKKFKKYQIQDKINLKWQLKGRKRRKILSACKLFLLSKLLEMHIFFKSIIFLCRGVLLICHLKKQKCWRKRVLRKTENKTQLVL